MAAAAAAAAATVKFSAPAPASYCCHFCLISYVTPGLKEAFVSSCFLRACPGSRSRSTLGLDHAAWVWLPSRQMYYTRLVNPLIKFFKVQFSTYLT